MTTLKRWIKSNKVQAVQVQTDTDTGTFTTRPMTLSASGDAIILNGNVWEVMESGDESCTTTSTLFIIEGRDSTVTLHKVNA